MLVFKFGGASVKDAQAVKNVAKIIGLYQNDKKVVVVSAMGKTTNLLEEITDALKEDNQDKFDYKMEQSYHFHLDIIDELGFEKTHKIYKEVFEIYDQLRKKRGGFFSDNYAYEYDQIVSIGEVLSTLIIDAFLRENGEKSVWVDARKIVRTDNSYRDANLDWTKTEILLKEKVLPLLNGSSTVITQGFIGHTNEGLTTTLGREGSDYTAGIIAYSLDAESVTIWKDVPGMLNADPKWFENTIKLDKISFKEAIELSYYGASVIHPKTIKPLQNKNIPLYVKSFIEPEKEGTVIQQSEEFDHLIPSFIFKLNQVLVSISPRDFSFIAEENLSKIFQLLSSINVKINLMQNSALSFSFAIDQDKVDIQKMYDLFKEDYSMKYNENLELVTIRHYDQKTIERVTKNRKVLLEQKTRLTARFLLKKIN
jgi:aspartate kinase